MTKLELMLSKIEPMVEKEFYKDGKIETNPMWFLEDEEAVEKMICFTPFEEDSDRDVVAQGMKILFKQKDIARYLAVMESWFVTRTDLNDHRPPSECEDRMEALVIVGEDRDTGESLMKMKKIDRSGGKVVLIDEGPLSRQDAVEGRFANMFDQHKTKH